MTPLYTAEATATAGREGTVKSNDGKINLPLSMPKELGGPGGEGINPEQLFAAGYAACFGSALKLVASQKKIAVTDVRITARVGIGKKDPAFGLGVTLIVQCGGIGTDQARELANAAHGICPYSLAVKNNIEVTLEVK